MLLKTLKKKSFSLESKKNQKQHGWLMLLMHFSKGDEGILGLVTNNPVQSHHYPTRIFCSGLLTGLPCLHTCLHHSLSSKMIPLKLKSYYVTPLLNTFPSGSSFYSSKPSNPAGAPGPAQPLRISKIPFPTWLLLGPRAAAWDHSRPCPSPDLQHYVSLLNIDLLNKIPWQSYLKCNQLSSIALSNLLSMLCLFSVTLPAYYVFYLVFTFVVYFLSTSIWCKLHKGLFVHWTFQMPRIVSGP